MPQPLGRPTPFFDDHLDVDVEAALDTAADVLGELGAEIVDVPLAGAADARSHFEVLAGQEVLLTPTLPGEVPLRTQADAPEVIEHLTRLLYPWSLVPGPTLSVPCGRHRSGTPVGLPLTGPAGGDVLVLAVGAVYQQVTDWHLAEPLTADDAFGPSV